MDAWLILTATLPTRPSGLRVRVWRALKATGAATLREGVYLLPAAAPSAAVLCELEQTIRQAGADAHLLELAPRDAQQQQAFRALFDRADQYAELMQAIRQARAAMRRSTEGELHRRLRGLEQQLHTIRGGDFFPGPDAERAAAALAALRLEVERHLSPGEPAPRDERIAREPRERYQGRRWATRRRPWVDRLATAWLIVRFVDTTPTFVWLDEPEKCPKSALGYDFDGARFTHVGDRVTFEVVAQTFGLDDDDAALRRLGELVRCIDIGGGTPLDEAAGVEMVVRGLKAQHADDEALRRSALPLFDALYAACGGRA